MSQMKTLHLTATEYLELGQQIKELEEKRAELRKELDDNMPVGERIDFGDTTYEWIQYERSSTSWKSLYTKAFSRLSEAQKPGMREDEEGAKKVGTFHKFDDINGEYFKGSK